MKGYKEKYVCSKCRAVHWYRPKECQKCKHPVLRKISVVSEKEEKLPKLDLEIDTLRLEQHIESYPNEYYQWSAALVKADAEFQKQKALLAHKEAEIDLDIRKDPEAHGLSKATESSVKSTILINPEYKLAVKKMNQARTRMKEIESAVKALETKRRSLQMAVELWIRDFHAELKTPNTEEKDEIRNRGRRRQEQQHEENQDD